MRASVLVHPANQQYRYGGSRLKNQVLSFLRGRRNDTVRRAAFIANIQRKRQLTPAEAGTCGLLFWFVPPRLCFDFPKYKAPAFVCRGFAF